MIFYIRFLFILIFVLTKNNFRITLIPKMLFTVNSQFSNFSGLGLDLRARLSYGQAVFQMFKNTEKKAKS